MELLGIAGPDGVILPTITFVAAGDAVVMAPKMNLTVAHVEAKIKARKIYTTFRYYDDIEHVTTVVVGFGGNRQ